MKKIILSVALLISGLTHAQDSIFNNKSIDFGVGVANILSPGSGVGFEGKYFDPLSLNLGYRVMLNRDFGISTNVAYNNFSGKSKTKEVSTNFYSFSVNGFLNLRSFLNFGEFSNKLGLLGHIGAGGSFNTIEKGQGYVPSTTRDIAIFVNAGLMPQYKINDKLAINLDFVLNLQKMQQLTLDMQSAKNDVGLGKYFGTATIGINYYCFGSKKDKVHADWAPRFDKNAADIAALKTRVQQVENKLADTDKDGVADYLDLEPNTPEGSIVNTHGQKVTDTDGDGIEDSQDFCPTVKGSLEFKGCPSAFVSAAESQEKEVEGQLKYDIEKYTTDINFQTKSSAVKLTSKKQLDGLAKILISNSNLVINLHGHCDNIGEDVLNNKLSLDRANSVRDYLVSKGVPASRITTKGHGTLKPKQSNETEKGREANRRVEFEVKTK
jgi:OOP family OmpA-OmpF porin